MKLMALTILLAAVEAVQFSASSPHCLPMFDEICGTAMNVAFSRLSNTNWNCECTTWHVSCVIFIRNWLKVLQLQLDCHAPNLAISSGILAGAGLGRISEKIARFRICKSQSQSLVERCWELLLGWQSLPSVILQIVQYELQLKCNINFIVRREFQWMLGLADKVDSSCVVKWINSLIWCVCVLFMHLLWYSSNAFSIDSALIVLAE